MKDEHLYLAIASALLLALTLVGFLSAISKPYPTSCPTWRHRRSALWRWPHAETTEATAEMGAMAMAQVQQAAAPPQAPNRAPTLRLTSPPDPDPLEATHQEILFRMAALYESQHPELSGMFHVPNGGHRSKATAAALKRQGAKAGVPDLLLLCARGGWFGLAIELKREHEGLPSDEQKAWLLRLQGAGYRAVCCFGWQMAWQEIKRYLALSPTEPVAFPPAYNPLPKRGAKKETP